MRKVAGVSGIILAGGKNARMGTDKALLKVGPYFIIERIAGVLCTLVDEILVVTARPELYARYGDKMVSDIMGGHGPLGGIHAGLVHAAYPRALVTACDMPFISAGLGGLLIRAAAGYDAAVPRYRGYLEPLCAVYTKNCIEVIERQLARGQNKITGFYDRVRVRYVEESDLRAVEPNLEQVFFNVNTPDDIKKAQLIVE
ncbi:molybdenum cofactor guanylyltransferase [Desulfoscipio geothermicus]|uniref:Probable molybdenum cofactor guanylyltransferase n=1 Tax=Desulfoscipio geothermicus DSM 3669 TaxID=1121426 RepID=A0A1I6DBX6_9FIRM|nr:molybdenum cofactor guanylyltransferase [Desulfoscipio geothermicus]SFR02908.1 molybdenum cofactor guanylyltransferase [Desulfoscipio geothermicus DSM 3669]